VSEPAELFTIGQLARRAGVRVRTIRFWSDLGVVPPAARSAAGYRMYDAEAVARLDLVRTLRELGFGLGDIEEILRLRITVSEVAEAHVAALDAQIRTLRLRRAVLSTVAKRGAQIEEMLLMHKLARLSAQERQQLIDEFVNQTFDGIAPDAPARGMATIMRELPGELPDDPSPEQVDAWVELAELVSDHDFQRRVREMAVADGAAYQLEPGPDYLAITEHVGQALADGITPDSPAGLAVLNRIVSPDIPPGQRARILQQLETFTDARVERYWQLLGIVNGRPPFAPMVPAFGWLIAALHA
jgi:DNA-binding transcriptional MerR regulator